MIAETLRRIWEEVGVPGRVSAVVGDQIPEYVPPEGGPWALLSYYPNDGGALPLCWIDDSFWTSEEEIAKVVQHFRDELARATPVAGAKEQPASGAPVMVKMVKLCARCGGDHKVTFTRLTNSIDIEGFRFEWWAMCPVLNEPIIMRMSMVEEDDQ